MPDQRFPPLPRRAPAGFPREQSRVCATARAHQILNGESGAPFKQQPQMGQPVKAQQHS